MNKSIQVFLELHKTGGLREELMAMTEEEVVLYVCRKQLRRGKPLPTLLEEMSDTPWAPLLKEQVANLQEISPES